ncbi:MAG: hypothetical protein MI754_13695, partial [Chromatiales bacterium]|nr:hypothetical protein [Chromatiales bacterium]
FGDYGSPGYIQRCISCHAGGGWMEKDRQGRRYDSVDPATVTALDGDYFTRGTDQKYPPTNPEVISQWDWQKSGVVENDCLLCHVDFKQLKTFDQALQIEDGPDAEDLFGTLRNTKLVRDGHFRYADSAILEYLNINVDGDEKSDKALVTFNKENVHAGSSHGSVSVDYDLQTGDDGAPLLAWNPEAFDEKGKVEIPMLSFPANDNCMQCHRTGNSRRGFYGFGEDAEATFDEEGMLEEDYKDDVHYGLTWTEANGESRAMTTCNACHARNYYRKAYENIDLNASHEFLKGNSDMNVHDDKDYQPNAKSCAYCHDDAEQPAIPSGHDSMLAAHLERWRSGGDLRGYPSSSLERITQVHLDVVSCQTCHITDKKSRGKPIQILYRYRREEDSKLRITPNNPRARYFWKDKSSGRVLTKTERDSVYRMQFDDEGNRYGEIFDPETGEAVAKVDVYMSHGSWRFRDVETYDDFVKLKQTFDKVLSVKGVENPDTALVWTEINNYLMSHNTRPAVSSVQCGDCHNQKQNGTYSSFISSDGILGQSNQREITQLIDKRLVDEGLVILEMPYMQVDAEGTVTENVSDIL